MADIFSHKPKLVKNIYGLTTDRGTIKMPGLDSAAIYLGSFVPFITGADATPSGAEFGIPAFTDDSRIFGIAVNILRNGSAIPIWEEDNSLIAGTITQPTGELPLKYTFAATNDESNTTSAKKEMVEVLPITSGDILEVTLFGGSTASVDRGTTTAAGTTTSSANIGVSMSVNATYPFALTESTAAVLTANLDFITVELDGLKPANSNRVFVMCMRSFTSFENAD